MLKSFFKKYNQILLFLLGFGGIYIILLLLNIIGAYDIMFYSFDVSILENRIDYANNIDLFTNYSVYICMFLIMLPFIGQKILRKVVLEFSIPDNIKEGIAFGVILVAVTLIYNQVIRIIFPFVTENQNETSVENIILINPFLSMFIVGILGPIVEEITYRLGLFGFLRKRSKILSYILTIIIFAIIHFEFNNQTLDQWINELINLPSYMLAAFILCYAYDYKGNLSTSITAHVFNNLLSVILTIIGSLMQ